MKDAQSHSSRIILVTGGLGLMGRKLSLALAAQGHRTRVLCLPAEAASPAAADLAARGIEILSGDVTRPETLPPALAGVDTVFHLAAVLFSPLQPRVYYTVNTYGTRNMLAAAEAAGIGHFIHVSSVSVTYWMLTAYSLSKGRAEKFVKEARVPATIVRPTLAYEDGGSVEFMRFVAHLKRFPMVILPEGGKARKNPVHVDDLVAGFLALIGRKESYRKTYHFAGGEVLTLREMAEALLIHMGRPKRIVGVPILLLFVLVLPAWIYGRLFRRAHAFTLQSLAGLCNDAAPEDQLAAADLGWKPRSFREGIATLRSLEGCLAR